MREWLTVIIILLIIGIVLDGIRRVRAARKERIHMSGSLPEASDYVEERGGSEFPSGGARIAGYRHPDDAAHVHEHLKTSLADSKKTAGLSPNEPAPVLMESTDEAAFEPALGDINALGDLDDDIAVAIPPKVAAKKAKPAARPQQEPAPVHNEPAEPEEVIVINVMAQNGYAFAGEDLLAVLAQQNLRFGSMDIFHRHKNEDGSGEILFSLANIVMPGTFDLNAIADFSSPGISMFMTLPIQGDSVAAFGLMARTAKAIAEGLQGELKDEQRSVMTQQTFEHCRQRVIEFERKRRLNR